jgi:hypothetical protein
VIRRLLEKYAQYQEQVARLQAPGQRREVEEEDMEDVLTPDDKSTAERVKRTISKLEQGELQLDETVMALSNYIHML